MDRQSSCWMFDGEIVRLAQRCGLRKGLPVRCHLSFFNIPAAGRVFRGRTAFNNGLAVEKMKPVHGG